MYIISAHISTHEARLHLVAITKLILTVFLIIIRCANPCAMLKYIIQMSNGKEVDIVNLSTRRKSCRPHFLRST